MKKLSRPASQTLKQSENNAVRILWGKGGANLQSLLLHVNRFKKKYSCADRRNYCTADV